MIIGTMRTGGSGMDLYKEKDTIAAGRRHTVGLKSDGTVVAVGRNKEGECDVSGWSGIVAIAAGSYHTIGLESDGTMAAVGWNVHGQCNVSGWRDIVAVAAGCAHTLGLKSDGTVVAVGDNVYGQCDLTLPMDESRGFLGD